MRSPSSGRERRADRKTSSSGPLSDQAFRQRLSHPRSDAAWFSSQQQQQVPRHYFSADSSPIALTPNFSSLSPLYPPPPQQHTPSAASSAAQRAMDDAVSEIFTRYVPTFFDLLEKYQYEKALLALDSDEETEWKSWPVFLVMLKLGASCESTYHLMNYLDKELVQTDTIEQMYGKLVKLMNHLAEELKPLVARQSRHFPIVSRTPTPSGNAHGSLNGGDENGSEVDSDPMLLMEIAMCGDMSYYAELLEQGAEFFSLRVPMLQLYRSLAHSNVPRDYHSMLKPLETLLMRFDAFDHPLLETMKQSAIEELSTVHAAIQCEIRVAEYDFTRSIVALHRLKRQLRSWSDHIDAVSDYPLFEDSGVNDAAGGGEGLLLLDEEDDNYGNTSDSVISSTSYSNQSMSSLARGHLPFQLTASMSGESYGGGGTTVPSGGAPSSLAGSLVSYRGARYANMGDTSYDIADETAMLERHPSGMSVNSNSSPVSETPSTIRRLLSQSSLLRRSGMLASALPIRRGLVQKPGDPYVSTGGETSSVPTNTLEQVILGGGGNGTAGTAGNGGNTLGASQTSTNGGGVGGNNNALAAEMMASSMKEQERDDGFALPVFQWSKRFYRSLVAKFTLYFHHWLNPFEKKTNYLGLKITRFIRTPLGISYLELMDVLLVKIGGGATQRGQGGKTQVMLILETQQLENKGAHYYESGYRCPSSSNARYSRTEQEDQDDQEEQEAKQKALASSSASSSSRTQSPVARAGGNSPLNEARRRSVEQQTNHALFMRVDREQNEEQNDFSELWGLRSWPAVFCYPDGSPPPLAHWPNLVSLIMDNRAALDTVRPVFMHFERRLRTTYHITRVDDAMFLVLLVEGVRKPNEKIAQDFMQTVTENLQHAGAFAPRVLASNTAISTNP